MAGRSSLPENVTRFKPCKCSRIRNDNGVYRVYKYSAVKLASGKWSSNYGYLIGKIIPGEGFFPNKRYQKELTEQELLSFPDGITDVCYGSYDKYCDWWGVYFLQTTAPDPAPVIYSDYKGRWAIETYNNYVKNDASFNDLKLQDYYVQHGFDFIMLVTGLIHEKLNAAVRSMKKSSISTFDLLVKAGHMRMVMRENEWQLHNTRTKDLELLKAVGYIPEQSYPV